MNLYLYIQINKCVYLMPMDYGGAAPETTVKCINFDFLELKQLTDVIWQP